MNSSAAISLFERPCPASWATRSSVSVSSSEAGARPLIRLSSARALLGPQPRAQLLEDRERLLERLPGSLLLPRLPAHCAEAEQRAGTLERIGTRF